MFDAEPRFESLLALSPKEIFVPSAPGRMAPQEIFKAVGHALTTWESLEEDLCRLFGEYIGTINPAVKRAYGSVVSSQGRIGMMKEVIQANYGVTWPETAALHTKAMNQIGALAGRRNEIAHGIVTNQTVNEKNFGYCLMPAEYNAGKTYSAGEYFSRVNAGSAHSEWLRFFLSRGKYVYTHVEITKYAEMFAIAKKDVQSVHLYLFESRVRHLAQAGGKRGQYHIVGGHTRSTEPPEPPQA